VNRVFVVIREFVTLWQQRTDSVSNQHRTQRKKRPQSVKLRWSASAAIL